MKKSVVKKMMVVVNFLALQLIISSLVAAPILCIEQTGTCIGEPNSDIVTI